MQGAPRMEAVLACSRIAFLAFAGLLWSTWFSPIALGQVRGAPMVSVATPNFIVYARDTEWAQQVAQVAEANRRDLAKHWLGEELPRWSKPCPLVVQDGPSKLASGETKYTLIQGAVVNFNMTVVGTRERILDSVLPHEITHTIIASHFAPFGKPVPRWADEGMCTTVEHESERRKHDKMLVQFLREQKGIPFATLFALRDYPADMLPLYAQGYSVTSFLIAQSGPREFIRFLELGMRNDDWYTATEQVYGYPLVGNLQTAWNNWVIDGGGAVNQHTALALGYSTRPLLAANAMVSSVQPAVANIGSDGSSVQLASGTVADTTRIAASTGLIDNKLMHPSTQLAPSGVAATTTASDGSYYLQQFQKHRESSSSSELTGSQGVEHTVGQPRAMQTLGGGTIYR